MVSESEVNRTIKIIRSDRAKVLAKVLYKHQDEFLTYPEMRKLTGDNGNIGSVRTSLKDNYGFVFDTCSTKVRLRGFKLICIVPTSNMLEAVNTIVAAKINNMSRSERLMNQIWK